MQETTIGNRVRKYSDDYISSDESDQEDEKVARAASPAIELTHASSMQEPFFASIISEGINEGPYKKKTDIVISSGCKA